GDALATAHFRGLVHGDVRPASILIDDALEPWLTDFDLVDHPGQADGRADVHGLGMTAIFGLYGRELPPDMGLRAKRIVPALPCGAALQAVLLRATDPSPALRFEDAARLCEALRRALASDGPRAGDVAEIPIHDGDGSADLDAMGPSSPDEMRERDRRDE